MRRVATPGEVADWMEFFEPLPKSRRVGVVAFITEVVADCFICEEPVRRCDPRRLHGERLVHLHCGVRR